jgi:hypothetical protein
MSVVKKLLFRFLSIPLRPFKHPCFEFYPKISFAYSIVHIFFATLQFAEPHIIQYILRQKFDEETSLTPPLRQGLRPTPSLTILTSCVVEKG